jgi:hypothetical protein
MVLDKLQCQEKSRLIVARLFRKKEKWVRIVEKFFARLSWRPGASFENRPLKNASEVFFDDTRILSLRRISRPLVAYAFSAMRDSPSPSVDVSEKGRKVERAEGRKVDPRKRTVEECKVAAFF